MTRLPGVKPKKVVQALKRAGFEVHHTTGSHYILKHPDATGLRVTVPYHNQDLKRGTLASIINQAGMTVDEFLSYL